MNTLSFSIHNNHASSCNRFTNGFRVILILKTQFRIFYLSVKNIFHVKTHTWDMPNMYLSMSKKTFSSCWFRLAKFWIYTIFLLHSHTSILITLMYRKPLLESSFVHYECFVLYRTTTKQSKLVPENPIDLDESVIRNWIITYAIFRPSFQILFYAITPQNLQQHLFKLFSRYWVGTNTVIYTFSLIIIRTFPTCRSMSECCDRNWSRQRNKWCTTTVLVLKHYDDHKYGTSCNAVMK